MRHVRLWTALATVAALAVLAGCGGGSDDAVDPRAALLTLADLPAGWTREPPDGADDEDDEFCGEATYEPDPIAEAEVEFASAGRRSFLGHAVGVYSEDVAERFFARYREQVTGCTRITQSLVTYTVAPLPFPPLGDESFASLLRFESDESSIAVVAVSARVGPAIVFVGTSNLGPPAVDEAERYARLAVRRLEDAAAGEAGRTRGRPRGGVSSGRDGWRATRPGSRSPARPARTWTSGARWA